ncbi:MAG: 5-formyltetrahydrofolate cyclo-ligase, partial [Firmicutes bacterium]|nr:5-formyltetrahydrofolate cyclo-ligase [Bacillota bacterium]
DGTHTLDLKGINLQLLQLCGVEDLQASTRCTCCEPESFYSYRRCGDQDRMLAYFYRKPQNGEPGFLPSLGVSRCLLGEPCRYDGLSKPDETVKRLGQHYYLVPVCPEQLGGLSTPRPASERRGAQVLMNTESGLLDVTRAYLRGAEAARDILFANGAFAAVLKSKSPSCGKGAVYDGSFTKTLIKGDGVAAELFENSGIGVIGSHETALLEGLFLTPQQRKTCKKALRKEVRAAERAMCLSEKQQADRAITEQILSMEEYRRARSVFAYVGTAKEIDTRALLCRILEDGKTLYLPLCTGDGIMQAKRVDDLAQLKPGAFGIPEPPAYLPSAALSDIDLTLIPCVSCSHDGKRLGQGGGFYDRFLARFQGDKVLLCREALTREDIPVEVHDIPIAVVVTDAGIVRS